MPLALLIASVHNPTTDPMRKTGGGGGNGTPTNRYAGVLPVPSSSIDSKAPSRLDSLLDQHHDARTDRGRVLYAAGHAPKTAAPAKNHHRQCSDHVASARGNSNTPNS